MWPSLGSGPGSRSQGRSGCRAEDREELGSAVAALTLVPFAGSASWAEWFLSLCAMTANTRMECLLCARVYVLDGVLALSPCVQ